MAAGLLLALLGAMGLGAVLVWLGLRGRRINRNPTCRWCGFDLSGMPAEGVTCPECGAGLKRAGAVRVGQRRRMWVVAAAGVALVLAPGAAVVATTYAVVTGANVNEYKPLGLLLWEARHGGAAASQAAAKEVLRRRQRSLLSEKQTVRVLETALEIQGDADRPWCEEWGDFVEMARTDGLVDDEGYARFGSNATVMALKTRAEVREGDPLPFELSYVDARLGSGSMFAVTAVLDRALVDGREIVGEPDRLMPPFGGRMGMMGPAGQGIPIWMGMVAGNGSPWAVGMSDQSERLSFPVPEDLGEGAHTLALELRLSAQEMNESGMMSFGENFGETSGGRRIELSAPFVLVPSDRTTLEVVDPTPELASELGGALQTQVHVFNNGIMGNQAYVSITPGTLPIDLAHEAFLRVGTKELALGPCIYHAKSRSAGSAWGMMMDSIDLTAQVGSVDIRGGKIVLKPDPQLALQTIDITRVYGGEIVLEGFDVQSADNHFEVEVGDGAQDEAEAGEPPAEESGSAIKHLIRRMFPDDGGG